MASPELQKRKQEEYEMQLFNFHSRAVYATLENIVSDRICNVIQKLCDTIEKTYDLNSANLETLKSNQKHLEKAYSKAALPYLANIQTIVNKYIAVPSNVLLEEDKYQRTQYSDSEFQSMKDRLKDLQQRAKRATILNTVLKDELQILEKFLISETSIKKVCNIIENYPIYLDNNKLHELVEDYKEFSKKLFVTQVTEKMKYNAIDNLKCKDLDLYNL